MSPEMDRSLFTTAAHSRLCLFRFYKNADSNPPPSTPWFNPYTHYLIALSLSDLSIILCQVCMLRYKRYTPQPFSHRSSTTITELQGLCCVDSNSKAARSPAYRQCPETREWRFGGTLQARQHHRPHHLHFVVQGIWWHAAAFFCRKKSSKNGVQWKKAVVSRDRGATSHRGQPMLETHGARTLLCWWQM